MPFSLGVDLGSTYTAAAVWRDGTVQTASLGDRANAVPSVVFLRPDGKVLTGEAARRRAVTEPARLARDFKRRMGDDVPVLLDGQPFTVAELTGYLLRSVVDTVREREGEPPGHVVLTHPATWGGYRTQLLVGAAGTAGLQDVGLLAEPVAAATWYAAQQRVPVGAFVGVYDFGGGTFDASVVRKTSSGFELVGEPGGDDRVGGVDLDHALFRHVAGAAGADLASLDDTEPETASGLERLLASVVDAKEALSADVEAVVPVQLPGLSRQIVVTRQQFETLVRPRILGTVRLFGQIVERAGAEPGGLHAVLLVGGSSRIPLVARLLAEELGVRVAVDAHPKYAVCLGAAIASGPRVQSSTLAGTLPSSQVPPTVPFPTTPLPPTPFPAPFPTTFPTTPTPAGEVPTAPIPTEQVSTTPIPVEQVPTTPFPTVPIPTSTTVPLQTSVPGTAFPGDTPTVAIPPFTVQPGANGPGTVATGPFGPGTVATGPFGPGTVATGPFGPGSGRPQPVRPVFERPEGPAGATATATAPAVRDPGVAQAIDLAGAGLTAPADTIVVTPTPSFVPRPVVREVEPPMVISTRGSGYRGRGVLTAAVTVGVIVAVLVVVVVVALQGRSSPRSGSPGAPRSAAGDGTTTGQMDASATLTGQLVAEPAGADALRGIAVLKSGTVVAVGSSVDLHPRTWVSTGGVWRATRAPDGTGAIADVATDLSRSRLVAVGWLRAGDGQRRAAAWTSKDGETWQPAVLSDLAAAGLAELTAVSAVDGGFLAAGPDRTTDTTDGDAAVFRSADGTRWQRATVTGLDGPGPQDVHRVVRTAGGGLVAVGAALTGARRGPMVWTSADGSQWRPTTTQPTGSATLWSVIERPDGALLSCGSAGSADSPTAVCWLRRGETAAWQSIGAAAESGSPTPLYVYGLADTGGDGGLLAVGVGRGPQSVDASAWRVRLPS